MITAQEDRKPEEVSIEIPLRWRNLESLPVLAANQTLVQVDQAAGRPDLVLLVFGHVAPPAVIGTAEEQAAQMAELSEIAVQPLVRLSLSPQRLRELVQLLQQTVKRWPGAPEEEK